MCVYVASPLRTKIYQIILGTTTIYNLKCLGAFIIIIIIIKGHNSIIQRIVKLISMTFPKLSGFIYFSKTIQGLEISVLKLNDFSRYIMTIQTLNVMIGCSYRNQTQI